MTRLIDADALSYQLAKQACIDGQPRAIKRAKRIVDVQPTVDAVPVVRCKDCRFGKETCGNIECNGEYHSYDWFCPNGKRREE